MTAYPNIQKDFTRTRDAIRARGLAGSLTRYTIVGMGIASAAVGNYVAPELIDAVRHAVEADMSLIAGPDRPDYGAALIRGMDAFAADTEAAIDWVWNPVASNIEHFNNGTLADHHKEWISGIKPLDIPVGQTALDVWDWATSPNDDARTVTGQYMKPVIGTAVASGMVALAGYKLSKATASTLDAATGAFHKGVDIAREAKAFSRKVFKAVRYGITKGVNAALGRDMPAGLENPFAVEAPAKAEPSLADRLVKTLTKAGATEAVARDVVEDLTGRIDGLEAREKSWEDQITSLSEDVDKLQRRVSAAESPERLDALVRGAVARLSETPETETGRAPTIH